MKKILITLFVMSMLAISVGFIMAAKPDKFDSQGNEVSWANSNQGCIKIQDGVLKTSEDDIIPTGFITEGPKAGYNYQAHMFNGFWGEDNLMMKWSDSWLANTDCDGDGSLDRHFGHDSYIGSGAWLTNHQSGEYEGDEYHTYYLNKKDSSTWEVVEPEVYGVMPFNAETYEFGGYNLDSIEYTLLNYGGWNAVQCIGKGLPNEYGYLYLEGEMPEVLLMDPNNEGFEKFWLVPSTAVNCEGENMLSWTPDEFLFDNYGDKTCYWDYFVKIVAAPADATVVDGIWYTADNTEIGPVIWGAFAIIQEVENDACEGLSGQQYLSPTRAGLGNW